MHVAPADSSSCLGDRTSAFSPRAFLGKRGTAPAARRIDSEQCSASSRCVGSGVLGSTAAILVRMERCADVRAAGDGRRLGSRKVAAVTARECSRAHSAHRCALPISVIDVARRSRYPWIGKRKPQRTSSRGFGDAIFAPGAGSRPDGQRSREKQKHGFCSTSKISLPSQSHRGTY